jgi:hypothetical protein
MHSKSNTYFNSIFKGGNNQGETTIDDLEIKLPGHLSNEYQERRAKFLESIMGKSR